MKNEIVKLTELERDQMVGTVQKVFIDEFKTESVYSGLSESRKKEVDEILKVIPTVKVHSLEQLKLLASSMLSDEAFDAYIDIAIKRASKKVTEDNKDKGVLVIYTGGTIGSAPKDINDPDSPEVVKEWTELKNATPNLENLGFRIDAISFVEPLDSCNVGPAHWRAMVETIEQYYDDYEGFVVLHGTDTLPYTSSALSFMLMNLKKPVVVTGSQVSGVVNPRNDAHQNMVTAIMLANPNASGIPVVPEVITYFGGKILRGCRTKKTHVIDFQGFTSPNYPELGKAGDSLIIDTKHIRTAEELDIEVWKDLDTNVSIVEVFPGMQNSNILANILQDEKLKGIILKAYGAGNIPTNPEFLSLFEEFIGRGGVVIAVTSVPAGEVEMGVYETSQILLDRGIVGGFDITPEAALCKLMVLFGNVKDTEEVKTLMQQSLVGEQRLSLEMSTFDEKGEVNVDTKTFKFKPVELHSTYEYNKIEDIVLSFKNVTIDSGGDTYASIKLLIDGTMVGAFKKGTMPTEGLMEDDTVGQSANFVISGHRELFKKIESSGKIKSTQKISFGIEIDGDASFAWDKAELSIFVNEK